MPQTFSDETDETDETDQLYFAIQESLQEIAAQMGKPISSEVAQQLYQEAVGLLSHVNYAPITLARVAATLLVYQLGQIEAEELEWLKTQIESTTEAEDVEELIESMSRESL
jgi:hypothetical protein